MENTYQYFNRDVSWLSFNYRVLMEAEDCSLPIYERIKFLSIYSSNMEEFYEIRVAEHRGVIMKKNYTEESSAEAEAILAEITREVNRQQREFQRIVNLLDCLHVIGVKHPVLYEAGFHQRVAIDFRNVFHRAVPHFSQKRFHARIRRREEGARARPQRGLLLGG